MCKQEFRKGQRVSVVRPGIALCAWDGEVVDVQACGWTHRYKVKTKSGERWELQRSLRIFDEVHWQKCMLWQHLKYNKDLEQEEDIQELLENELEEATIGEFGRAAKLLGRLGLLDEACNICIHYHPNGYCSQLDCHDLPLDFYCAYFLVDCNALLHLAKSIDGYEACGNCEHWEPCNSHVGACFLLNNALVDNDFHCIKYKQKQEEVDD